MAERETQEDPSEHQEAVFYWEGDQELLQITWRGAGLSILADTQKFSVSDPGQLMLGSPAWWKSLDQTASRGSFQSQSFCDSVMLVFIDYYAESGVHSGNIKPNTPIFPSTLHAHITSQGKKKCFVEVINSSAAFP